MVLCCCFRGEKVSVPLINIPIHGYKVLSAVHKLKHSTPTRYLLNLFHRVAWQAPHAAQMALQQTLLPQQQQPVSFCFSNFPYFPLKTSGVIFCVPDFWVLFTLFRAHFLLFYIWTMPAFWIPYPTGINYHSGPMLLSSCCVVMVWDWHCFLDVIQIYAKREEKWHCPIVTPLICHVTDILATNKKFTQTFMYS